MSKNPDPVYKQHAVLAPIVDAMERALEDEDLLRHIFAAMGPYSFNGVAQDPEAWKLCLDELRDRFDFDDSE